MIQNKMDKRIDKNLIIFQTIIIYKKENHERIRRNLNMWIYKLLILRISTNYIYKWFFNNFSNYKLTYKSENWFKKLYFLRFW